MKAEWKSQQGEGRFAIQFETDDRGLYKAVEKACQTAIDEADRVNAAHKKADFDARMPMTAEWVFIGSTTFGDDDEEIVEECPVCRRRVYRYGNQEQDNFCPRCGTHMFLSESAD